MLMAREFPAGRFENWTKCQTLLPHIESVLQCEPPDKDLLREWTEVVSNAAWYMWTKGSYKAAESMAMKAVRTRERIEGRDDPRTLTSITILALVLQYQGKYEPAEEMNRRVLDGERRRWGKSTRTRWKACTT
ncbi:hypothetical protein K469DRAFT_256016 [Zopfia rhizophila CBS 207.26]|uniref:MalT-like TPR region domain-containing protein n=1 Tax=Zopfia rhizophila CBS 207.26 TaxID=1314779 RepID=A0A6A6DU79_9PEZI|nr:hypothetical protein K469DRAFT_256016 [Zopfia rhizophila CBS 207.26]